MKNILYLSLLITLAIFSNVYSKKVKFLAEKNNSNSLSSMNTQQNVLKTKIKSPNDLYGNFEFKFMNISQYLRIFDLKRQITQNKGGDPNSFQLQYNGQVLSDDTLVNGVTPKFQYNGKYNDLEIIVEPSINN